MNKYLFLPKVSREGHIVQEIGAISCLQSEGQGASKTGGRHFFSQPLHLLNSGPCGIYLNLLVPVWIL